MSKIYEQLYNVQSEIRDPIKDQEAYGYKYATLESYLEIIRPLLKKNELFLRQDVHCGDVIGDGTYFDKKGKEFKYPIIQVKISTIVYNKEGEKVESKSLPMIVEGSHKMSLAQATGAAISYGKRYALAAFFGMSSEDYDAYVKREERKQEEAKKTTLVNDDFHNNVRGMIDKIGLNPIEFSISGKESNDDLEEIVNNALSEKGRDPEKAKKHFGVFSFGEMTLSDFDALITAMNKVKK